MDYTEPLRFLKTFRQIIKVTVWRQKVRAHNKRFSNQREFEFATSSKSFASSPNMGRLQFRVSRERTKNNKASIDFNRKEILRALFYRNPLSRRHDQSDFCANPSWEKSNVFFEQIGVLLFLLFNRVIVTEKCQKLFLPRLKLISWKTTRITYSEDDLD